jgi:hypothetical protein
MLSSLVGSSSTACVDEHHSARLLECTCQAHHTECRYIGLQSIVTSRPAPLLAATCKQHAIVQLGDHVLAVYSRTSAVAAPEGGGFSSVDWVRWMRPLMLLGMVAFGSLHFVRAKAGMGGMNKYSRSMGSSQRAEAMLRANGLGGTAALGRNRAIGPRSMQGMRGRMAQAGALGALGAHAQDMYELEPHEVC